MSPTQSPEIKKKMKHNLQKKENLKKLRLFDKVNSDRDDVRHFSMSSLNPYDSGFMVKLVKTISMSYNEEKF